jgi:hypothetical protein
MSSESCPYLAQSPLKPRHHLVTAPLICSFAPCLPPASCPLKSRYRVRVRASIHRTSGYYIQGCSKVPQALISRTNLFFWGELVPKRVLLLSLMLLVGALLLPMASTSVKASDFFSGSPVLGTGEVYQIILSDVPEGALIMWSWSADGNVESHFVTPQGTDISWNVNGSTSNAQDSWGWQTFYAGNYTMWWRNNNWFFSATLDYYASRYRAY